MHQAKGQNKNDSMHGEPNQQRLALSGALAGMFAIRPRWISTLRMLTW